MRRIIGVLRDSDESIEPSHTVADIERIFNTGAGEIPVSVHLNGELDDLGASVEAGYSGWRRSRLPMPANTLATLAGSLSISTVLPNLFT